MHCVYRPRPGQEEALFALLKKHWTTLKRAGLVTSTPPLVYRATEKRSGRPFFIEIFSWRDEEAPGIAHQLPEVMAIWEPMGALTEARGGRPAMEFPHVQPIQVLGAA